MTRTALIYGGTGYMGELTARRAREAGLEPILAGRNATALAPVAEELGLPVRAFAITDPAAVDAGLDGVHVLLNAAGPFETTGPPLLDGCLRTGTHYLDFAGETPFFSHAMDRDTAAAAAGVMVLPGAGFGVVATDLVAARAAAGMPNVRELDIAFRTEGGVSRGTASVLLPTLHHAGVTRRDGALVPAAPASRRKKVDFGDGRPRTVVLNPWRADLVSAAVSTGAATVTTYQELPAPLVALMRRGRIGAAALDSRVWQAMLRGVIGRLPAGPSEKQLAAGSVQVRADAHGATGSRTCVLDGPEAYEFTALAAVAILRRMRHDDVPTGFRTPTTAFGVELLDEIPGVRVREPADTAG